MAYRLLIIPGDNEALRALQGQLAEDIEVQVLDSANDALWEVRNAPPEAIVADVHLPGMSGLDLAEILPNFGVPTKVVLWSRQPDRQAAQQAANHGVYRFLNGPISADELHSVLYDALGRSSATEAESAAESAAQAAQTPPADEPAPPPPAAEPPPTPAKPATGPLTPPEQPAAGRLRRDRPAPAPTPAPPPAAKPPAAPSKPPTRRREGPLVLTSDNLTPIRSRMEALWQDVGAQCIMLADRAGMVLTETGITAGLPMMILLPLLSTSFSTAGQIAQMLREEESTSLFMHEGGKYDIYCFDVLQRFMLVIVFDKAASAAKIGSVWVYAKRAIRDIQEVLA
jgi:DNA-binding NarL/FixJ family response regulator/predicted regulator of Ras-like GTPase activity (Roadblock/LC7/MglB family)